MRTISKLAAWAACLFALFAGPAVAQQQEFRVGPLYAGISVRDAVAAIPDAQWIETHSTPSGRLIGAKADNAVNFDGALWNVSIGRPEHFGGDVSDDVDAHRDAYTNRYELRFERELPRNSARQCRADFAALVTTLEITLGPFGMEADFPDTRSPLYFNPYGPGMRVERIGRLSRMRIWPKDGMQPLYTFREPTPGFPYRTGIGLDIWEDNSCTLKFEIFQMPPPMSSAQVQELAFPEGPEGALPSVAHRPSFETPPAGISAPASFRLADVSAARGNIARWRDETRRQLGPFNESPAGAANMPGVSGYFAFFGGEGVAPGIIHGRWFDAASGENQPSRMSMLTFAVPRAICTAQVYWANTAISDVTYLGPEWRPEFEPLDAALRASGPAQQEPSFLPDDVALSFTSAPNATDVTRYYPARAMERDTEGRVRLGCLVLADHHLRCGVIEAEPATFAGAFASAATRIMQLDRVRVAETAANGQATAGLCVRRNISFRLG